MVYCAYCGKEFTRKEHLERHIPNHTHIKPHVCGSCGLSYSRRDLLQRHYTTFHEPRDPMEPLPGGVPTVAGRTPIACQNCASAKTGCDKRVPCGRCSDKGLPCAARFARRSSKAAVRAAQASAQLQQQKHVNPAAISPPFIEVNQHGGEVDDKKSTTFMESVITVDTKMEGSPKKSPTQSHGAEFPSPHTTQDDRVFDDYMQSSNDFPLQDLMNWPHADYQEGYFDNVDMTFSNPIPMARADISMPAFQVGDLEDITASEPMTASSSRNSIHTRGTSIISSDFDMNLKRLDLAMAPTDSSIPEHDVVLVAEGAWNLARCNPPTFSGNCPRTAIVHLECLERKSREEGTWSSLEKYLEQVDWDAPDLNTVEKLTPHTRDMMLAITQGYLQKALEIHRDGIPGCASTSGRKSPGGATIFVLPPAQILDYFLRSYVRSLSVYYPLVTASRVDPNEMLENGNQASTLLVLLMIAQGAAAMPMAEARYLSSGLTETCRISLFDIVEKDVQLSADPTVLRCALLFIVLGAWSGDKWLMDIAMGQRGMYISMIKYAGMLNPQPAMIPVVENPSNAANQWHAWVERESRNRLVYNYVMLDQELSLFHDVAPLFAACDLQCPLPGPEALWQCPNAEYWATTMQSTYGNTINVNPQLLTTSCDVTPSLYDLFQDFLVDNLGSRPALTPQQLRLILHPIQGLICHLRQILACFSDPLGSRRTSGQTVTKASTTQRLEEVQGLLRKWYEMTRTYLKSNPNCPITHCNLVLYHLIALNAVTNFPEIERLARRENFDGSYWELSLRNKRCIFQREEAIFHCGQVFRLLKAMPNNRRPAWWSTAMYRATLILWTDSNSRLDPSFQTNDKRGNGSDTSASVAIDQVTPDDQAVLQYLWNGGTAVLTRTDGTTITLDQPADIINYTIKHIENGFSCRIGDGIKRKLITLGDNWRSNSMGHFGS
ncbi:hypothetical protein QBC35DRAFT_23737 [Podospora australis]|uniref:Transcription factor n=1 Tax=Podospora australis TaxID=1536484 RepID=A0AAN6WZR3_9PEZI|nr:hypothetical protein QBC35DRAFT_23737 [Podospora australis]